MVFLMFFPMVPMVKHVIPTIVFRNASNVSPNCCDCMVKSGRDASSGSTCSGSNHEPTIYSLYGYGWLVYDKLWLVYMYHL